MKGQNFGTMFFVLLSFAAWTSAIGLIEPAVAWVNERFGVTRWLATSLLGFLIWAIGLLSAFSFNILSHITTPFGTLFDMMDYVTSNIMLPLGAFLIVVFAGWAMCRNSTSDELGSSGTWYRAWRFLARFVAPIGILFVLANAIL